MTQAQLLTVEHAGRDRLRRLALAATLAGLTSGALVLLLDPPPRWGLPAAVGLVGVAGVVAVAGGLHRRLVAMARLGFIRRAGLAATDRLTAGDVAGAEQAFTALLEVARPLQAFHATHVLMLGVCRFLQGDTARGLELSGRALDSGWFEGRRMARLGSVARGWRALMLTHAGRLDEARALLASADVFPTARVVLLATERRWSEAVDAATALLSDPSLTPSARPAIAAVGHFAALQAGADPRPFAQVLADEPLSGAALRNPALAPFLPQAGGANPNS